MTIKWHRVLSVHAARKRAEIDASPSCGYFCGAKSFAKGTRRESVVNPISSHESDLSVADVAKTVEVSVENERVFGMIEEPLNETCGDSYPRKSG